MGSVGPFEIIIVLVIALVIFGPKNLPKLGSAVGKTVKNVREGMEGDEDADKDEASKAEAAEKPAKIETEATSVEEAAPVTEHAADDDVVFCSKCGAKNAADAAFCSKCGAKLAAGE